MRKTLAVFTVLLSTFLAAGPASAIVYGELDGNGHPNVGSIVADFPDDDPDEGLVQWCSGSLIAPTVFLTASHCTAALEAFGVEDAYVTFAPVIDESAVLIPATPVTNPNYNGFAGPGGAADPGDIAVMLLAWDPGVTPVQLPPAGLLDQMAASRQLRTQRFTAVGYGAVRATRTGGFGSIQPNLERRVATQGFLALHTSWITLSMNEARGDGGTCYGDSGGPHFLGAEATETNIQISLTVTGDAVCKATDTTYRLDTPSAREFLDDFVTLP